MDAVMLQTLHAEGATRMDELVGLPGVEEDIKNLNVRLAFQKWFKNSLTSQLKAVEEMVSDLTFEGAEEEFNSMKSDHVFPPEVIDKIKNYKKVTLEKKEKLQMKIEAVDVDISDIEDELVEKRKEKKELEKESQETRVKTANAWK